MSGETPAVQLVSATRVFSLARGRKVRALDGVDLRLESGTVAVLAGPSGSGKTTVLNLVAGLDRPSSGSVSVLGAELGGLDDDELTQWRRGTVACIFQAKGLIGHLTAAEDVDLGMRLAGVADANVRRDRVERALERVGLADHRHHRPGQLSGGQQQRVAIARALAVEAPLLVADEPTGELDTDTSAAMIELLVSDTHRRGATALITTHDEGFRASADQAFDLVDGVIR